MLRTNNGFNAANIAGAALGSPVALARLLKGNGKKDKAKEKAREAKNAKETVKRERNGAGTDRRQMAKYIVSMENAIEKLTDALEATDERLDELEATADANADTLMGEGYSNAGLFGDMDLLIEGLNGYILTVNVPDAVQSTIALQASHVLGTLSGRLGQRLGVMTGRWLEVVRLGFTAYAYWNIEQGLTGVLTGGTPATGGTTPEAWATIQAFIDALAESNPDAGVVAQAFYDDGAE